jgi:hypothetical protein
MIFVADTFFFMFTINKALSQDKITEAKFNKKVAAKLSNPKFQSMSVFVVVLSNPKFQSMSVLGAVLYVLVVVLSNPKFQIRHVGGVRMFTSSRVLSYI